jgi:putative toxin-antitoxin system antitoxin component (TIGR02293 family)
VDVVERVAEILGGPAQLQGRIKTWDELDRVVRRGLPKRSLQHVARRALGKDAALNDFINSIVPAATYKRRTRLSAAESERTERLARVIAQAEALWGDEDAARAFLNRPHPLLDGATPLDVARTELGARRVESLLYDVEYGLPL